MRFFGRMIYPVSILIFVSVLASFLAWAYLPRVPSEFQRNYDRIENGMTVDEVRRMLGAETEESREDACQIGTEGGVKNAVHGERVLVWERSPQIIRVGFDKDRVVSKYFFEYDL